MINPKQLLDWLTSKDFIIIAQFRDKQDPAYYAAKRWKDRKKLKKYY